MGSSADPNLDAGPVFKYLQTCDISGLGKGGTYGANSHRQIGNLYEKAFMADWINYKFTDKDWCVFHGFD